MLAAEQDETVGRAQDDGRRVIIHVVRGRPSEANRGTLPAGHPTTWGTITAGTIIEGAKYPHPVFVP